MYSDSDFCTEIDKASCLGMVRRGCRGKKSSCRIFRGNARHLADGMLLLSLRLLVAENLPLFFATGGKEHTENKDPKICPIFSQRRNDS